MTAIINLRCEYRHNPLGIDIVLPRFSWQMATERPGARQTAYHILAASDQEHLQQGVGNVWDSGKITSDQSVHVVYNGQKLASRQRVYWQVTVWDENNAASRSEPAWFEMGLLSRDDWQAEWIAGRLTGAPYTTIPAPYLRKPFTLSAAVQAARLYVTAFGVYECSINGQLVSDDVFAPGWTDYNKRIQYQVYDVTALLQTGENVIGAIVGDGWAVGHLGEVSRQMYVDRPRFYAQLEITLTDGSKTTIVSDGSWRHRYGPLVEGDFQMGEAHDARQEMPGWDAIHVNDKDWLPVDVFEKTGAALVATNGPTVKRFEELHPIADPVDKSNFDRTSHIFDLGQNMVGRVRFKGSAPAGTTIALRFAEVLDDDGSLYTANLRTARATDHYTFKDNNEVIWEPKFTFHGFRYVELLYYPGDVSRETITGIVLHSDMVVTGEFECSDPLINQLQRNIVWGQKGNFLDVPTDCPQRDERLGWTGDIQVFAQTAAFNMDIATFMTKWAQDVVDAQGPQGEIPPIVPYIRSAFPLDGGPAWADAVIIGPWTLYQTYGDQRLLEELYDAMTHFMEFMLTNSPGYIRCAPDYDGWLGFGDWLSINADTPRDLIGTAFLAYDANLMAQIAAVLGKSDDVIRYQRLFGEAKTAFANRYLIGSSVTAETDTYAGSGVVHADTVSRGTLPVIDYGPIESNVFNTQLFTPTQTAYVLALHFDLLPDELRPLAINELVADIERRDMHLSTGFVGAPYLPHVLSDNGRLDIAYALLNQQGWPSWLYPVTQGATTIWERWDGWTEENGFQTPKMNSFNHYAYGSIGAWLYRTVTGIEVDPTAPGYKHMIIHPQPGGSLTAAAARLQTPYGELVSEWQINDTVFTLTVIVPPNTGATVHLPPSQGTQATLNGEAIRGNTHTLQAGNYVFSMT